MKARQEQAWAEGEEEEEEATGSELGDFGVESLENSEGSEGAEEGLKRGSEDNFRTPTASAESLEELGLSPKEHAVARESELRRRKQSMKAYCM